MLVDSLVLYLEVKKMKKITFKHFVVLLLIILFLLWGNDYLSYRRRIGNTGFYFVETMAMSKDGKALAGLYYKTPFGYKGVEMPGFPRTVLWNDKYLISKNYDGNNSAFFCYVIINQDSVNASDGNIENIRVFITETDYYTYLQQIGLSESNMNQTDNHIAWWEVIL